MSTPQPATHLEIHRARAAVAPLLIALGVLACSGAQAQPAVGVLRPLTAPPSAVISIQSNDIGTSAAASAAARATGGRVLSVKRGNADVYLVKVLLAGGKLRIVSVDARSGQLR